MASSFRFRVAAAAGVFVLLSAGGLATCPNGCSKNGVCSLNNTCTCEATHMGADCSLRRCPNGTHAGWTSQQLPMLPMPRRSAPTWAYATAPRASAGKVFAGSACQIMRCLGALSRAKTGRGARYLHDHAAGGQDNRRIQTCPLNNICHLGC